MWKATFRLLTELTSRKWVSQITGYIAKSSISRHFIPKFARMYGIRLEDAEKAIEDYGSLNEFFTRRLKQGMRPINEEAKSLVSPVDGVITGIGPIKDGQLINVKGQDYTLDHLLNHSPRIVNYLDGFYMVIYLSPTDYHRIHSPVKGEILETEHITGRVYPVNDFGMRHMKYTLSRNERLISYIRHEIGEVAVVKVGAMNVSSIQYVKPLTNHLERGQELAYFEFGSTVVLLMENGTFSSRIDLMCNSKVLMGESLGILHGRN